MRLDKFLQVSRLVRRRALANSLCHAGRVTLNDRRGDPSSPVRPGDIVTVEAAGRRVRARIRAVPEERAQPGEDEYCEILEERAAE